MVQRVKIPLFGPRLISAHPQLTKGQRKADRATRLSCPSNTSAHRCSCAPLGRSSHRSCVVTETDFSHKQGGGFYSRTAQVDLSSNTLILEKHAGDIKMNEEKKK